jgi:hypothetical protein
MENPKSCPDEDPDDRPKPCHLVRSANGHTFDGLLNCSDEFFSEISSGKLHAGLDDVSTKRARP